MRPRAPLRFRAARSPPAFRRSALSPAVLPLLADHGASEYRTRCSTQHCAGINHMTVRTQMETPPFATEVIGVAAARSIMTHRGEDELSRACRSHLFSRRRSPCPCAARSLPIAMVSCPYRNPAVFQWSTEH